MLSLAIRKTFRHRKEAFCLDIDLSFDQERIVFFGPSGSGKTVTMKMIAGLIQPDAGLIQLGSEILYSSQQNIWIKPQKRRIGYMPQDYALFPHLTVMQNIAYPFSGLFGRFISPKLKASTLALMARLGIAHLANYLPGQISGGQQQRVALGRAINLQPRCLLLDEPFSALDPLLRRALRNETLAILRELSMPAIIITHDPDDVEAFAGGVVLFRDGRARAIENWPEIRSAHPSAYEALLTLMASDRQTS